MDEPEGFLDMYRERFVMALAKRYCDGGITWDEYVRTSQVVQVVLDELRGEVDELRRAREARRAG